MHVWKKGDKCILKYPEKSKWQDIEDGLEHGRIIRNAVHIITDIYDHEGRHYVPANSVRIRPIDASPFQADWGLSVECLIPFSNKKYNLPDWF